MEKEKKAGKSKKAEQKKDSAVKKPELFFCSACQTEKPKSDFYQSPTRGRGNEGIGTRCKSCEKDTVITQNYRKMLRNKGRESVIALRDRHQQLVAILDGVLEEAKKSKS